jgi:DNA-binding NarL/FixJ family response regulator
MSIVRPSSSHIPDVATRKNGPPRIVSRVMARRRNGGGPADLRSAGEQSVVVVAKDRAIRTRAAGLLTDADVTVSARVASVESVIELCVADPEIVVIICCADTEAQTILRLLKRSAPGARVVLVALRDAAGRVMRTALRTQVEAVVYRSQLDQALLPTVQAVFAELVVFPRSERRSLEPPALSHREREVLRLAVQGFTNDEIGARLYLATSTVKSHLTSAFSKLAVRSRSEAAALIFNPEEPAGRAILAELMNGPAEVTPR